MIETTDSTLFEMCDLKRLKAAADHEPNAYFNMDGIQYQIKIQTAYEHHKRFDMGTNITSEDIAAMEAEDVWWLFVALDKEHNPTLAYLANRDTLSGWLEKQKRKLAWGTRVYAGTDLWNKAREVLEQSFDIHEIEKLDKSFCDRASYNEKSGIPLEFLENHCLELRPDDIGKDLRRQIGNMLKLRKKVCRNCNGEFGVSNFNKQKDKADGLEGKCKTCREQMRKDKREQDPAYLEECRQKALEYRNSLFGAVYCIKNTATGQCYIGKAKKYIMRKSGHITRLRRQEHENSILQEDWTKFGEDAFEFSVLEEMPAQCDDGILLERETHYMQDYIDRGIKLYNIDRRCLLK